MQEVQGQKAQEVSELEDACGGSPHTQRTNLPQSQFPSLNSVHTMKPLIKDTPKEDNLSTKKEHVHYLQCLNDGHPVR